MNTTKRTTDFEREIFDETRQERIINLKKKRKNK